ncbi:MAG: hypothetical protein WAW20_13580 [Anaerolineae bacterium]
MAKIRCPYGTRRAHQDGLALASHMDGYIWNCWSGRLIAQDHHEQILIICSW